MLGFRCLLGCLDGLGFLDDLVYSSPAGGFVSYQANQHIFVIFLPRGTVGAERFLLIFVLLFSRGAVGAKQFGGGRGAVGAERNSFKFLHFQIK